MVFLPKGLLGLIIEIDRRQQNWFQVHNSPLQLLILLKSGFLKFIAVWWYGQTLFVTAVDQMKVKDG